MQEVIQDIDKWLSESKTVGLATVIQTWGSAPRKAGGKMAITLDGKISGSVSGGCVEGAVFDEAASSIGTRQSKLLQFGIADETAWEVGLACGGNIRVFVEMLDLDIYTTARDLIKQDRFGSIGTIVSSANPSLVGLKFVTNKDEVVAGKLHAEAAEVALATMKSGKSQLTELADGSELFIEVFLPAPQLIMIGGVHIAVALVQMAKILGYQTIVIDPRKGFGNDERFPNVDKLIQKWPKAAFDEIKINENTAVALLTHDPKIDDPALHQVLDSAAFYIGALGSRKTHAKRVDRLLEAGYSQAQIGRIYGPIGLSINAQNPEEIALSVMTEIIKARRS
ncbi:MAG: xanthine dehydrogenase accessory factor [Cellvibrionaceae bacterium]|jgi:xanthine dehydrogenase accessory factor